MHFLLLSTFFGFIFDHSDIFVAIIIGAIGGYLAEYLVPGRGYGFFATVGIGILGGWIGQLLFAFINIPTDIPYFNTILRTILGAMLVVIVVNLLTRNIDRKRKDRDVYDWSNE